MYIKSSNVKVCKHFLNRIQYRLWDSVVLLCYFYQYLLLFALAVRSTPHRFCFVFFLLLLFLFLLLTAWSKYSSAKKQESYPRCKFESNKRYNTKYVLIIPCISYFNVCHVDHMHTSVSEKIFNRLLVSKKKAIYWTDPIVFPNGKENTCILVLAPTKCFDPFQSHSLALIIFWRKKKKGACLLPSYA